jgi:hypothetical protein
MLAYFFCQHKYPPCGVGWTIRVIISPNFNMYIYGPSTCFVGFYGRWESPLYGNRDPEVLFARMLGFCVATRSFRYGSVAKGVHTLFWVVCLRSLVGGDFRCLEPRNHRVMGFCCATPTSTVAASQKRVTVFSVRGAWFAAACIAWYRWCYRQSAAMWMSV